MTSTPSDRLTNGAQRIALARLVGICEAFISGGDLPPKDEQRLRELTNDVCAHFDMASVAERMTPLADELNLDFDEHNTLNHAQQGL